MRTTDGQNTSERPAPFQSRKHRIIADVHGDPIEALSNLFDVAILIGIGFLVVSLASLGMREFLTKENFTVVKNPGAANMEIVSRSNGVVTRLKATNAEASGAGTAVGTVYRLRNGQVVWVPSQAPKP